MGLHESGQMYLESILVLQNKNGSVRSIDVVEYMGYSKPSVSRAVGLLKNGEYIMCGDNQFMLEYGIFNKHILAKMKAFVRDGETVDESNPKYRKYMKRLPMRTYKKRIRNFLGRIKRKIFKKKTV